MKPHLTSSSTTISEYDRDGTAQALAYPYPVIGGRAGRVRTAHARERLTLVGAPVWRHKLIVTGRLDHSTAVELEDEIECLCEEGVTTLTLDLRQLDAIDSVGAMTIAFRGAACRRSGHDFVVIPGSPVVRRALAEAGAESLLADDLGETGILRLAPVASEHSPRDTSTAMIKNL